jgi:hypothetical protein
VAFDLSESSRASSIEGNALGVSDARTNDGEGPASERIHGHDVPATSPLFVPNSASWTVFAFVFSTCLK